MDSDHPCRTRSSPGPAGSWFWRATDVVEPNLVWKNIALIRNGETVDMLLDITNRAAAWLTAISSSTTRAG